MKHTTKAIVFSTMITLVFFGILELSTRLIFSSNTVFNINIGAFKAYHPTRRAQLKSGYHQGDISINSHGLLGPEFDLATSKKQVRILILGDSVAFIPPQKNYGRILETHLSTMFGNESIEVLVGAVPGYTSYDALDWYNEFLHQLNPDITLIALGWNDMGQYHPFGLQYKNAGLYRDQTVIAKLMEIFYFMRIPYVIMGYIEKAREIDLSPLTVKEREILDSFTPTHYEKNLVALIQKLKSNGSAVYLLTLAGLITYSPHDKELTRIHFPRNINKKLHIYQQIYQTYNDRIADVAQHMQIPTLDLRTLITSPEKRDIFTDTMHLNAEGAEVYGRFIAEKIKSHVAQLLAQKSPAS